MWLTVLCWWAVLAIGWVFINVAKSMMNDACKAYNAGKDFVPLLLCAISLIGLGLLLMLAGLTYPMVVLLKIAQALNV